MTKILITGGTGFIGRHLVVALQKRGYDDIVITSRTSNEDVSALTLDITSRAAVSHVVAQVKPNWIFHLAGDTGRQSGPEAETQLRAVNVEGTRNLLDAAAANGVQAFINAGSFSEYGDAQTPFREDREAHPQSLYGKTKKEASELVAAYGKSKLHACVLRFPVIYGPESSAQSFMGALRDAVSRGEKVILTQGDQERDFVHVDDAAAALVVAAENVERCHGEIINACSGVAVRFSEIIDIGEKILGRQIAGSVPAQTPSFSYVGSTEKAERLLDWRPRISLENGVGSLLGAALS